MKLKRKKLFLLLAVFLFASFLRFYKITKIPPEIFSDELHSANAALSYLKTGKDIDGKIHSFFYDPMQFFPPIMSISMLPGFILFGPNPFIIRLPGALYGILSIFIFFNLVYFLSKSFNVSLISTLILSIIPWHFHYSRFGWEQASFLFYLLSGIYFFLKGRDDKKLIPLGFLFFGLSFYSYSTAMLFSPLFLLAILLIYQKDYLKNLNFIILGFLIFLLIITPFIHASLTEPLMYQRAKRIFVATGKTPTSVLLTTTNNYLKHFSPEFLFINGDPNLRHNVKKVGEIYFFMFPFALIGLISIIGKKNRNSLFILFWLLFYPLASALTDDGNPHATRSLIGAPLFSFLSGFGIVKIKKLLDPKTRILFFSLLSLICFFEVSRYFKEYFIYYPVYSANAWNYGQSEVFSYVKKNEKYYQKVCFNHLDWYTLSHNLRYYLSEIQPHAKFLNNPEIKDCLKSNSLLVLRSEIPAPKNTILIHQINDLSNIPLYNLYKVDFKINN